MNQMIIINHNKHFKIKTMKKAILIPMLIASLAITYASCGSNEKKEDNQTTHEYNEQQEAKTYTCPMHPEITSDKPGTCSTCGMDLEKVQ